MMSIPLGFGWFMLVLWTLMFLCRFVMMATENYPRAELYSRETDAWRTFVALVYAAVWGYFMFWPK